MTDSIPTSAPRILALSHGFEKLRIFGRFHRDLRVEDEVVGQLLESAISSKRSARMASSLSS